jgi:membrane-associated phospholipid phosphatase
MSTVSRHTNIASAGRLNGTRSFTMPHAGFLAAEIVLLVLFVILALVVHANPGPLPGDVGITLDLQHWLLPHKTVTDAMNLASTLAWPIPSAITVGVITGIFLVLRRWLDAIVVLLLPGIANGSNYLISKAVHRPRPSDHGVYVAQHVSVTYSFPSGHVLQAVVFFGFLLFLSFVLFRPAPWLWPARIVLILVILDMGPSRLLQGEHWPSDELGAFVYGIFWVLLAIHVYTWAGHRWPKLRGQAPPAEAAEHAL